MLVHLGRVPYEWSAHLVFVAPSDALSSVMACVPEGVDLGFMLLLPY